MAVRAARGDRTQLEFSQQIGVTPMTVSRWERGEGAPNKFTRRCLARRYPEIFTRAAIDRMDAAFAGRAA